MSGEVITFPNGEKYRRREDGTWGAVIDVGGGWDQPVIGVLTGVEQDGGLSNGIPGLLGAGGVMADLGLDRVPWWIWAVAATGVVIVLSGRRG